MEITSQSIIVEQIYQAPGEKVWKALVDPKQMRSWFFEQIPNFEPKVGFQTRFDVKENGKVYPHLWKVLEVIHGQELTLDWKYGGYEGDSKVRFELFPGKGTTRLKVTHTGIESFPQENPDFSRESCTNGWKHFLQDRLKKYLENSL